MKKAYFYIDDTIWVLRDITRQTPKKLFENSFLNVLKSLHDNYGLKVQLNLFYRVDSFYGNDDFCLADVTDAYKEEFMANSDWLKMAFHSKEEYPDYPLVNIPYKDAYDMFKSVEKEVFRFAGKECFSYAVCPHWTPVSKEGVRAFRDCGVKLLDVTRGNTMEFEEVKGFLPYGHDLRLLNNRQNETKIFCRNEIFTKEDRNSAINNAICGYNHISYELGEEMRGTDSILWNEEMGIYFKQFCSTGLNITPYNELEKEYGELCKMDYIGICDHEQYFYPDYFAYQSDHVDRLYKMCEIVKAHGFEFINGEDLLINKA